MQLILLLFGMPIYFLVHFINSICKLEKHRIVHCRCLVHWPAIMDLSARDIRKYLDSFYWQYVQVTQLPGADPGLVVGGGVNPEVWAPTQYI